MSTQTIRTIRLGKEQVSMMDPPNEGTLIDLDGVAWNIGRNSSAAIVLRNGSTCHPDFREGMFMSEFVQWINAQLV